MSFDHGATGDINALSRLIFHKRFIRKVTWVLWFTVHAPEHIKSEIMWGKRKKKAGIEGNYTEIACCGLNINLFGVTGNGII